MKQSIMRRLSLGTNYTFLEITAKGVPCIASFVVCDPEPDVGINRPWIEDLALHDRRGYRAYWLEKKFNGHEWQELEREVLEKYFDRGELE